MNAVPRCCAVLAVLLAIAGCVQTEAARLRVLESAAEKLRYREDADSLAAAALLLAISDAAASLELIARAARDADRPELAHLHLTICARSESCDPRPLEQRLRALAPDNAAGWLGDLARALDAQDDDALDAALDAIGRAPRFDIYFTTLTYRLSDAADAADAMPLNEAMLTVIGFAAGVAMPRFHPLSRACEAERFDRAGVLDACRALAESLIAGDSAIVESLGHSIAQRVWPPDSAGYLAAVEARRTWRYRMHAAIALEAESRFSRHDAAELLQSFREHRREQDAMAARLLAHGVDPTPPPDWREPAN
jgi:hypothetical protein